MRETIARWFFFLFHKEESLTTRLIYLTRQISMESDMVRIHVLKGSVLHCLRQEWYYKHAVRFCVRQLMAMLRMHMPDVKEQDVCDDEHVLQHPDMLRYYTMMGVPFGCLYCKSRVEHGCSQYYRNCKSVTHGECDRPMKRDDCNCGHCGHYDWRLWSQQMGENDEHVELGVLLQEPGCDCCDLTIGVVNPQEPMHGCKDFYYAVKLD